MKMDPLLWILTMMVRQEKKITPGHGGGATKKEDLGGVGKPPDPLRVKHLTILMEVCRAMITSMVASNSFLLHSLSKNLKNQILTSTGVGLPMQKQCHLLGLHLLVHRLIEETEEVMCRDTGVEVEADTSHLLDPQRSLPRCYLLRTPL